MDTTANVDKRFGYRTAVSTRVTDVVVAKLARAIVPLIESSWGLGQESKKVPLTFEANKERTVVVMVSMSI